MGNDEDSMRLPLVDDDVGDSAVRAVFERTIDGSGAVPNLYRQLAHAPELLEAWIAFAWPLRHAAVTDRGLRELLILRVAQLQGADYEWRHHWQMAIDCGVGPEALDALARWQQDPEFSPSERAALRMADELTVDGGLSDTTWSELCKHFNERSRVELILTTSFYACVSRVLKGLLTPLESEYRHLPPVPELPH